MSARRPGAGSTVTRPTTRNQTSIGVDFGTTNTVIAIARPGEVVRAVTFHDDREQSDIYRSVLCFEQIAANRFDVVAYAGMKAIRAYLASAHETRFIQSFKSHVASAIFDETRIFSRGVQVRGSAVDVFSPLHPRCRRPARRSRRPRRLWAAGRFCRCRAGREARRSSLLRGVPEDRYPRPYLRL